MTTRVRLRGLIPAPLRRLLRKLRPASPGPGWYPAPSIHQQLITFTHGHRTLTLEADHSIPLYETIAELVDYDAYQLKAVRLPEQGPLLMLDIGANIGAASVLLAGWPGARVLAYEPLPANGRALTANLQRNGIHHVTWRPAAITDRDGQAEFLAGEEANVGGRLAGSTSGGKRLTVDTLSWASVLREAGEAEIFLVKMDCEGGEYDILRQFDANTARRIRYLTFEVHDLDADRSIVTLQKRLQQLGYRTRYKADIFKRPWLHHLLAESSLLIPES